MSKKLEMEQFNTFGITENSLVSVIKIGNTNFIVTSIYESKREFTQSMENVIKKKIESQ